MAETFDLLLKNGTVVNEDGAAIRDVAVTGGRIRAIGSFDAAQAGEVVDCTGLHVLPGVVDSQVHFREPGNEHKEDLETGSRAAVMGGVTAVFEMPNTNPQTTTGTALADKVARGRDRMHCDFAFWVGASHDNIADLTELERLEGVAGVKVFMGSSTGTLLVEDDEGIAAILAAIRRRAAFHSEDEYRLNARMDLRVHGDPSSHPVWRDEETAFSSTRRLVRLARAAGKRIHILHVTTAEEIAFLADHKDVASVEVTPNHLTLSADDYPRLGTYMQMNPPVRDARHRTALWHAIGQGLVDVIGSDHAPHTREEKDRHYPASPSGMPGVQTLVPLLLDRVVSGDLALSRFVDLTSAGPARLFGMSGKGRLAVGYDADFTVVDLARAETIRNEWIASRCGWTPFDGVTVRGWPVGTIVRGRRVMWEGELVTPGTGRPVRFLEALPQEM